MKKYLLTILALLSVTTMANDDFKASVTAAYGTRTSIYKGREEGVSKNFKREKEREFTVNKEERKEKKEEKEEVKRWEKERKEGKEEEEKGKEEGRKKK